MVEIGGRPIIWHIMKHYAKFGFDEFVICLGYRGDVIKEFFLNYGAYKGSLTVKLGKDEVVRHLDDQAENWTVHLLETGESTMTGGRIKRAANFLGGRRFMATYGDGLSNIDLDALLAFHTSGSRKATISAVRPPARFGGLILQNECVKEFTEKPQIGEGWINGGFMVFEPSVVDYIEGDSTVLERAPLEALANEGSLGAFRHEGFWQCMDTVRDLSLLRELWDSGSPPWLPRA
jgi:glucose-1-phosphate cytidylyltransferase